MHHSLRSITSSEAKSNLGELLASLGSQGAVEITRNGKPVGILSPPFAQPVDAGRLAFLALAYSKGLGRVINQIRSCDLGIPHQASHTMEAARRMAPRKLRAVLT